MEPSVDKKVRRKWFQWLPVILLACLVLAGGLVSVLALNRQEIYSNIYIDTVPVGGLSREEAAEKGRAYYQQLIQERVLSFYYGDANWNYDYTHLGYIVHLEEALEEAYDYGRRGNWLERMKTIAGLWSDSHVISVRTELDESRMEAVLEELGQGVRQESTNAKLQRVNGRFVITDEKPGIELDKQALRKEINLALKAYQPAPIELPVESTQPQITEEVLSQLEGPIGSFTTTFNAGVSGRSANIELASKSIDGLLLMPGDFFSFNTQTGPRGVEEGYQEAPIIVNGQLVPGIGGGICQVSTTLYNAVVRANLEIVERRNHSLPVSYVPLGHDATVAYGYIDFRFTNDQSFPIYLESYVEGNQITVTLYGKQNIGSHVELESQVVETIEPQTEIKEDDTLFSDESRVEREGKPGYRVRTYKVYLEDGREVNRELISSDYYTPVHGVKVQGTKARETAVEEPDLEEETRETGGPEE